MLGDLRLLFPSFSPWLDKGSAAQTYRLPRGPCRPQGRWCCHSQSVGVAGDKLCAASVRPQAY